MSWPGRHLVGASVAANVFHLSTLKLCALPALGTAKLAAMKKAPAVREILLTLVSVADSDCFWRSLPSIAP